MQTIVIKAENNIKKSQELTEVTHLVDFLVTGESEEATQNAKEEFMLTVSDKLSDISTMGDGIFQFKDGSGDEKTLVVSPIYVDLEGGEIGTEDKPNTYAFMMGAVPEETIIEVALYQSSDLKLYLACGLALFLSLLLSTYCVHKTSFAVIFPLRKLNMRMTEILQDEHLDAVSLAFKMSRIHFGVSLNLCEQFAKYFYLRFFIMLGYEV